MPITTEVLIDTDGKFGGQSTSLYGSRINRGGVTKNVLCIKAQPIEKGAHYPPDVEPYIANSGDLTRDKIAKLIEMVIDNTGR